MLVFNKHLRRLINDNNNDEARSLLTTKRPSEISADITGNTLLHHASSCGNKVMTRHLIDLGCNVDERNHDSKTPIMLAVEAGHKSTVKVLLKANANIGILDSCGKSVLRMVADRTETTALPIAKLLLDRVRRESCCRTRMARTLFDANWPLFYAVSLTDVQLTRIMLELGSPIDALATKYNISGLHAAVLILDAEQVKMLVDHGADVNIKCADGSSPLGCLHEFDDIKTARKIIKVLLEGGTRWTDCEVDVPMQVYNVCVFGRREVVRTLMECNVDLRVKDANGETLLHYLVENKHPGVLEELTGRDFDVNCRDDFGLTPLHKAVWCDNVEAIRFLLECGADVEAKAHNGFTPIFYAFVESYRSLYQLEENEENSEIVEKRGRRVVEILSEHGAEIEVSGDHGVMSVFEMSHFQSSPQARIVVSRAAMLDVLGRPIRFDVPKNPWMKRHFDLCKKRYERMKVTRIYGSVTMLDLLTKSDRQIMFYARNRQLVLNLAAMINEGVPDCYHYRLIQKRLADAVVKIDVRNRAVEVLERIAECSYSNSRVVAELVVDYLGMKEWVTLRKLL